MLEILLAIKNNNINKIPTSSEQCYSTYIEHIQKLIRSYYKYNKTPAELAISYEDLLNGKCYFLKFVASIFKLLKFYDLTNKLIKFFNI